MTTTKSSVGWKVDPNFTENFNNLSKEFWDRYRGKHVAFSLDARSVRATGDSYEELFAQLEQLGIDPGSVVVDYLD